jgi:hypothetical protein
LSVIVIGASAVKVIVFDGSGCLIDVSVSFPATVYVELGAIGVVGRPIVRDTECFTVLYVLIIESLALYKLSPAK